MPTVICSGLLQWLLVVLSRTYVRQWNIKCRCHEMSNVICTGPLQWPLAAPPAGWGPLPVIANSRSQPISSSVYPNVIHCSFLSSLSLSHMIYLIHRCYINLRRSCFSVRVPSWRDIMIWKFFGVIGAKLGAHLLHIGGFFFRLPPPLARY